MKHLWLFAFAFAFAFAVPLPPALAQPARAEPAPTLDLIREHVWTPTLNEVGKGQYFCEAVLLGRNPPAGGDYSVRLRVTDIVSLGISFTRPAMPAGTPLTLSIDDQQILAEPGIVGPRYDAQYSLWVEMNFQTFEERLSPALLAPSARWLVVQIGKRRFMAPVVNFFTVQTAMNNCQDEAAKRRRESAAATRNPPARSIDERSNPQP